MESKNQINAKWLSSSPQGVCPMARKHCHLPSRLLSQERLSLSLNQLYRNHINQHFDNLQWNGHKGAISPRCPRTWLNRPPAKVVPRQEVSGSIWHWAMVEGPAPDISSLKVSLHTSPQEQPAIPAAQNLLIPAMSLVYQHLNLIYFKAC